MIYLIYGTDRNKITAKSGELISALKKKKPTAEVFVLSDDLATVSKFEELSSGQGLFENKYIVLVKNVFSGKDYSDNFLNLLPALHRSSNIFIFVEDKLNKPVTDSFKSSGGQLQEFSLKREVFSHADSKSDFNIFSLADALGARDRKNLWVLYQKARNRDVAPEEISGTLFWQLKSILISESAKTATEAGINPFVFQKARRFSGNFRSGEVKELALSLIRLYHDAHRGLVDFEVGLERLILSV